MVCVLSCLLQTFSALTTASLINSFQCTGPNSKRPKNEEDKEVSAAVSETKGSICDPVPVGLKVSEKPEEAIKLGNTEAPSEEATSPSRMQLDPNSSDNVRLSGEKVAVSYITCRLLMI